MISLNLNSPHQKKQIRLNRLYHLLKGNLSFVLIISIVSAIILLVARNDLQKSYNDITAAATLLNQQIRGSNQKITIINEELNKIKKIQSQFIPWSNLLVYLTKNTPPNIQLNFLIIQTLPESQAPPAGGQWQITFKGLAKHRDDFLLFKEKLEKIELFDKVEIPLNQLTQKENLDFEIKASLSDDGLKAKLKP
ncbi:MAG: hypothetical protein V1684_03135 [bacterium]